MPVYLESQTPKEKLSPVFERRIVHLEKIMTVVCDFTNGPAPEPDKPHSHPHEQITFVAEGELFFFLGSEKHHLRKGDLVTVPKDVPHSIQNISSFVRLVDSFTPIREDFLR